MNIRNRLERDIYNTTEPKARTYNQLMSIVRKIRKDRPNLQANSSYIEEITNLVKTPVTPYNKCIIDANGRECTRCQTYKVRDEYYNMPSGKNPYCKDCSKKYNKERKEKRLAK